MAQPTDTTRGILRPDAGRAHFALVSRPPAEDLAAHVERQILERYRMHEAPERIAAGGAHDGVSLARELGYFDQSHVIRDFAAQFGVPPSLYERGCAAAAQRPAPARA